MQKYLYTTKNVLAAGVKRVQIHRLEKSRKIKIRKVKSNN